MEENNTSGGANPQATDASQSQAPVEQPAAEAAAAPEAQPAAAQPTQAAPAAQPTAQMPQGASVMQGQPVQPPVQQPSATAPLVLGILAIVFCFIPIVGIVLGILAIVFAGRYFKAGGTLGQGKAGRICGIIGIVLSVIMMIVNTVAIIAALTFMDDYDLDYRASSTTPPAISSSSASSSAQAPTSAAESEQEAEIEAVVSAQLDLIKNKDPQMMASIAAIVDDSFTDFMELVGLKATMAECGVDPAAFVNEMAKGFDYSPSFMTVVDDDGSADFDLTMVDIQDILQALTDAVTTNADGFNAMSDDEKKAFIGTTIMTAAQNAKTVEDVSYFDVDLEYEGGQWVIDHDDWEDETEYFFGFE